MIPDSFTAYFVDYHHQASVQQVSTDSLPDHVVTIKVHYSSLNYKDALSARGLNNVTRCYPHIPGIDAVGKILDDKTGRYKINDWVIVTGNDLGTNTYGGFGGLIKVPVEWLVPLPTTMSPVESMVMGTAGFTALYGIHRLKVEGIQPDSGPILVTGSTGGVGSFAVFALSSIGYDVFASTRKSEVNTFLEHLGAHEIISSNDLIPENTRPLHPRKWAGCIETVGGKLLDAVLTQTYPKGAVTCCGNVMGIELKTNVLPFILRGIALLGIDSAFCVRSLREEIWKQAAKLDFKQLPENYFKIVTLDKIDTEIDKILSGGQIGRIVISHQ